MGDAEGEAEVGGLVGYFVGYFVRLYTVGERDSMGDVEGTVVVGGCDEAVTAAHQYKKSNIFHAILTNST